MSGAAVKASQGWAKIAAAALAAAVSAILIAWVHLGAPSIDDLRIQNAMLASIPRPDIAALPYAEFAPATPPFWHATRFGVARIEVDVPDPQADVALFTFRARDNYLVYINGKLAAPPLGTVADRSTIQGLNPRLTKLLPAHLKPGTNTIDILSATNGVNATLNYAYFGPYARLEPAYRHATALAHDTSLVAIIGAGMVLLFALALSPVIRKPALLLSTALLLLLTFINELHGIWTDAPWTYRNVYVFMTGVPLWIACAAFANEWTGGPAAYRRWFLMSGLAACALVAALFTVYPSSTATPITNVVQSVVGACALGFMIRHMFGFYYAAPPSSAAEVFVACVGLIMALTLLVTQSIALFIPIKIGVEGEAFTKLGTISLIVFIAVGLARNGVAIYQQAAINNQALAFKIYEKERELEANHVMLRDRQLERALHEERTRIMRDVHDGIGSQLLGLLLQARAHTPANQTLVAGLQAAIDDLYLVVDSLDDVHGSLETALGTFRSRIEPKCTAAGIDIVWRIEDIANARTFGPADVLQIYRILHEALSNAITHDDPKKLTIALRQEHNGVLLSLHADGTGTAVDGRTSSRALASMHQRAAAIEAQLDFVSDATGTCAKLLLPARETAPRSSANL